MFGIDGCLCVCKVVTWVAIDIHIFDNCPDNVDC
jgi:hypothetical protein